MIALNKLLEEIELYKSAYQAKGLEFDLDIFIKLADKLKSAQLESEGARAKCNKLCASVVEVRDNDTKLNELMAEINMLDSTSNKAKKSAEKIEKEINSKLSKLHNLPDYIESTDKLLSSGHMSNLKDFFSMLSNLGGITEENVTAIKYLKAQSNKILLQKDFPMITSLSDSTAVILCDKENVETLVGNLLSYLYVNSLFTKQISTKKLSKSSSSEYLSKLNENTVVKVEIKREFYTREFKIKYRDKALDRTNFANEIDIKITKKR